MTLPPRPVDDADIPRFIQAMQGHPRAAPALQAQALWNRGLDSKREFFRNGKWTLERAASHQAILRKWKDEAELGARGTPPRACIIIGLPGAGKNSRLLPQLRARDTSVHWVVIDPDDVKLDLPGYEGPKACLYHEESSMVARHVLWNEAVARGYNIVSMEIGSTVVNVAEKVDLLLAADYVVEAWLASIPAYVSVYNVAQRYEDKQRWVPLDLVQEWQPLVGATWTMLVSNPQVTKQVWDMTQNPPVAAGPFT